MMNKIRDLIQKLKKKAPARDEDSTSEHDVVFEDSKVNLKEEGEIHPAQTGDLPPPQPLDKDTDSLDLEGGKLSFKDRLQMGASNATEKLKDKINRIDFRKFKSPEYVNEDGTDSEGGKALWTKGNLLEQARAWLSSADTQKLKRFHVEVFSPSRRNQIHKGFQYAIIFGSVFILGKNLALLLKGADTDVEKGLAGANIDTSKALTKSAINEIRNSNIFKTEPSKPVDTEKKPVIAENVKCKRADRKSRLPIKLLNTIVLQDSVKSIASVQVRSSSEQTEVREGDKINGMAKIDQIERQKIIVKNLKDGNCEVIENQDEARPSQIAVMSPSQSRAFKRRQLKIDGIENEGNNYTIEKSFIQDKMKNISDILTQARGIQITNPDGTLSFKIVDVEPGGIFSYLGIQNNDLITEINGKKINNLNEVMSTFGNISKIDKMKITVNRDGAQVPLDYTIK